VPKEEAEALLAELSWRGIASFSVQGESALPTDLPRPGSNISVSPPEHVNLAVDAALKQITEATQRALDNITQVAATTIAHISTAADTIVVRSAEAAGEAGNAGRETRPPGERAQASQRGRGLGVVANVTDSPVPLVPTTSGHQCRQLRTSTAGILVPVGRIYADNETGTTAERGGVGTTRPLSCTDGFLQGRRPRLRWPADLYRRRAIRWRRRIRAAVGRRCRWP
jgi:hypothetical protein